MRLVLEQSFPRLFKSYPGKGSKIRRRLIMSETVKGTVKWFNESKGYGFLSQPEGEDIFVHYTSIQGNGFRTLKEGQEVEFNVERGPKGLQASNVTIL
jgi:CspA family cold shock protein